MPIVGRLIVANSVVSIAPWSVLASNRTVHRITPAFTVRRQPGRLSQTRQATCPRFLTLPSDTAETAPTQRDHDLQHIAEHGRMAWQKASGYMERARAEAAIGRWKQVIGDRLRAHTDERRATEVEVAVYTLNRMLEFARPSYVRIG